MSSHAIREELSKKKLNCLGVNCMPKLTCSAMRFMLNACKRFGGPCHKTNV